MSIEFTATPDSADINFLTQKIDAETPEFGPVYPFGFFLRDKDNYIVAGCNGFVIYGAIYTDQLWVDHRHRNTGLGCALMQRVHDYGREVGCTMATLATMSFQGAQGFYEKLGYKIDFERKGYTKGSSFLCLIKMLGMEQLTHADLNVSIREFRASDIPLIVQEFQNAKWPKPAETFETYLQEQLDAKRCVWIADVNGKFAGYVTLKWTSQYEPFATKGIPEIMDLNVLPDFRKAGVGSTLLDHAEKEAVKKSDVVGLGVGLYGGPDGGYGAAQKLYIKRGYIPDGKGVSYGYHHAIPGDHYRLDDDLILWFTKRLR